MSKQLTKADIKLIAELWNSKDRQEIADIIGCSAPTIGVIVRKMRDMGVKNLPKKRNKGVLDGLIKEVVAELS